MEGSSFTSARSEDANHRASLRHLLSTEHDAASQPSPGAGVQQHHSSARRDRDASPRPDSTRGNKAPVAMTTTTRRNKAGNVSSVYSGNRISFLKKDDGEPFWRKDIQYLFLRTVFSDQRRVFTKASDGTTGHTFAEIYIDAMAKSSKCSQILKDKLLNDTPGAIDMAMICLLVNVGRMNTTLNFFPEMRARVRTYHSIPSLQAQQGVQAYKQLQDGPRLKSILKGATEDSAQPSTIEEIMSHPKPRTNPVNLIFVLSQYAPKISEMHFFPPRDFFDIFIRVTLSSKSRATAFLWMIWWYLESDFSMEAALNNPFGRGQAGDDGGIPIKVPPFDILTEEEAAQENVDTPEEIAFGQDKKLEREAILANDMPPTATAPKRGNRTPLMEQQHNYRFRVSPYGSSASGSDAGSRGRASPSPPPRDSRPEGLIGSHGARLDREMTQSPALVPPRSTGFQPSPEVSAAGLANPRIANQLNEGRTATPPSGATKNKGVGRGNYPRKPKEPTLQPFEQVHRHSSLQNNSQANYPGQPVSEYQDLPTSRNVSRLLSTPGLASAGARGGAGNNGSMDGYWPTSNGPLGESQTGAAQGGGARRRNPSAHQQALERSRRERVNYLLYRNMRSVQKAQRRQRRRRGILADAWIKCSALTPGWDSEEDESLSRLGGVDSITRLDSVETDDVGARTSEWAKAFRKVGRKMGAGALIDRDRNTHRGRGRRNIFKLEDEPLGLDDGPTPTPPRDHLGSFAELREEVVAKEKKRKGPYKRRVFKDKKPDGEDGSPATPVKIERRRGVKRTLDGRVKSAGQSSSKLDVPGSGKRQRGGRGGRGGARAKGTERPARAAVEAEEAGGEDEEMDEMDRELLAQLGGDESPAASVNGDDDEMGSEAGDVTFGGDEGAEATPEVVVVDD